MQCVCENSVRLLQFFASLLMMNAVCLPTNAEHLRHTIVALDASRALDAAVQSEGVQSNGAGKQQMTCRAGTHYLHTPDLDGRTMRPACRA